MYRLRRYRWSEGKVHVDRSQVLIVQKVNSGRMTWKSGAFLLVKTVSIVNKMSNLNNVSLKKSQWLEGGLCYDYVI